ncbi:SprT-like domain-containing protein [Candidatus Spongiihabitans sp.]|uniref:SprT-like domain-containing protein n=1 Tax=Candidatus Spongiihabitans sp. TaxID=3101308 RepID=UPI003C7E7085
MHDPDNLDKLKARVSPGDLVRFEFRGQRLHGAVSTLGPKYAGITVADGERYRVPYQLIRSLGETKDYSDQEQGALENCRKLLRKHGLSDWSACLDEAMNRAGACKYSNKQISLSRLFLRAASEREILDTILHEIAHALAGPEHHHDAVWRKIARDIGCSGERCHNLEFSRPRWIMQCPNGCFAHARKRRARGLVCKKCKQPVRFVPWTKERALALNDCR